MKKNEIIALLVGVVLILSACDVQATTATVMEGRHQREPGYPAEFMTKFLVLCDYTVHMETRIYEESDLRSAAAHVLADLEALETFTGVAPYAVDVYIVSDTISGSAQVSGEHIFCTADEIEDGRYRASLTQAAYDLTEYWQGVGLSNLTFCEDNTIESIKYYADPENTIMLSMFPIYFLPGISDHETLEAASNTARGVVEMLLECGGLDMLRSANGAKAGLNWAKSVGIDAELPEGYDKVSNMTIGPITSYYITLSSQGALNNFRFELSDVEWLDTPDKIYSFLCSFYAGHTELVRVLQNELENTHAELREHGNSNIAIKFLDSDMNSYNNMGVIYLSREIDIWHEVLHVLLPSTSQKDSWLGEGIIEYFAAPIESEFGIKSEYYEGWYGYLTDNEGYRQAYEDGKVDYDNIAIRQFIVDSYTSRRELPKNIEDLDVGWLKRCLGAMITLSGDMEYADEFGTLCSSIAEVNGFKASTKLEDGNSLTYVEALLMTDYLATQFGIDALVRKYLSGATYIEIFGAEYSQLYNNFINWVEDEFCA